MAYEPVFYHLKIYGFRSDMCNFLFFYAPNTTRRTPQLLLVAHLCCLFLEYYILLYIL